MGTTRCQGKEGEGGRMIIVTGQVRFGEGEVERLKDVLANNIRSSRAEEGCEHYAYGLDLDDPNLIHITEMWRDSAALDAHSARIPELMAPLAGADIREISIKAYEATFLQTVMGE
ncbi:putative quinol monooxygenase [Sphingosinicella sp.]|uniref:putative quinol monooxygenase n=1 Tax=Sphingosinicella sp. TaxID=1917971 RepID=UPI004037BCF7